MSDDPTTPTTAKRPRKSEIVEAIKLLRSEATSSRNHADGNRILAEQKPEYREHFLKSATAREARADRIEKVVAWIETL